MGTGIRGPFALELGTHVPNLHGSGTPVPVALGPWAGCLSRIRPSLGMLCTQQQSVEGGVFFTLFIYSGKRPIPCIFKEQQRLNLNA